MEKKEVLLKIEVHVPKNVKDILAYIIRNLDNRCIVSVRGIKP